MTTSVVEYLGELRTKCTHIASQTSILTDAPVDNHGKGEFFSPTDLLATAYASCMLSIIGIYCNTHGLSYQQGKASVQKIMESNPRRIGKIVIQMDLSGNNWDNETQEKVVRAAKACPVAKSVHDSIEMEFDFQF